VAIRRTRKDSCLTNFAAVCCRLGEGHRSTRTPGACIAVLITLLLAACSSGPTLAPPATPAPTNSAAAQPTPSESATSPPEGSPRISLPVVPGSTVEGLVDVNGHDLYARCAGKGSRTVLYFTGWADDRAKRAVAIATGIEAASAQRSGSAPTNAATLVAARRSKAPRVRRT
jgi:hypothetical protein